MSEKPCTNVLENFLVIARSLNDHESAVEIINKVIDSPAIYSFGDLLEVPLINSVGIVFLKYMLFKSLSFIFLDEK